MSDLDLFIKELRLAGYDAALHGSDKELYEYGVIHLPRYWGNIVIHMELKFGQYNTYFLDGDNELVDKYYEKFEDMATYISEMLRVVEEADA